MVGFAEALTSITAGLGIVRDLVSINHEFDKAELKLKAAELMETLATAKVALIDAREELQGKDIEIAKLKETMTKQAETVEYEGFTYEAGTNGKPIGLPYCPRCWGKDVTMMRLISTGPRFADVLCPECKTTYVLTTRFDYPKITS